ncbi:MAG: molybdate ABC transporter substrate-binding protein, partial [Ilumatobacter sp.]|nr:molybdate ABC transporter substrate-binding protein [Ilumatobacter sp.]
MRRTGLLALAAFVPFVALAACGGDADGDDEVVVFAAASLTDAFTDIGAAYTTETGVAVTTSFAGSSDLARQIAEGAPADVFASADLANMAKVAEAAPDAVVFATNRAEIVVEAGNPHGVAD